jgi:hypothetical protein
MDLVLFHISERSLRPLDENDVLAMTFLIHMTSISGTFNLVFHDALTRLKSRTVDNFGDNSVNSQITRFVQGDEQTARLVAVHGSFWKVKLTADTSSRPLKLRFNEEKFRGN